MKKNKKEIVRVSKPWLKSILARLNTYKKKYLIQSGISVALVFVVIILIYKVPFLKAAPTADSVTITSGAEWNLGSLSDVTVSSDAIEISGDGGANWLAESGWVFRQKLTFDATSLSGAVNNIPLLIHIENTNTDFWNTVTNRDEVRFSDSDGTELDFHFEKFDHTSDDALAWIEVPELQANNTDHIYVYYGKSGAINGEDEMGTYDNDGNFIGVWHLDETPSSSGSYDDSTSNGNDATWEDSDSSGSSSAVGKIDGGNQFNLNDRIGTPITAGLNDFTVEMWFKDDGIRTSYERIADKNYTGCFWLGRNSTVANSWGGGIKEGGPPYGIFITLTDGNWNQITNVRDGSNHYLYGNGGDQYNSATGLSATACDNTPFGIGAYGAPASTQQRYGGVIDEVRLSSVARSADWVKAAYLSESDTLISSWGAEESALQSPGTYTSQNLDMQYIYAWGDCTAGCIGGSTAFTTNVVTPANTSAKFEVRHSADGSTGWSSWTTIDTYTTSGTHTKNRTEMVALVGDIFDRYIQTRITLVSSDGVSNPSVADYRYDYTTDIDVPTNVSSPASAYSEDGGDPLTTATWYDHTAPYFTFAGASDADSGMSGGYSGYWVCFGADDCEPTSGTFVSSAAYTSPELTSSGNYHLRIKARDAAGNVAASAYDAFTYQLDITNPTNPSGILPNPAGFTNIDNFSFTWNTGSDAHSGLFQYCWRTGGTPEGAENDTCQTETTVSGVQSYKEGANLFYVRTKDLVGNMLDYYTSVIYYYSANAPSTPQNLQVDPIENTENSFTFTWLEPASYSNPIKGYHYSINAIPNADNTTYTTSNSIGPDAFATQQGANVFYVVAEDTAGNIEWSAYSSIEFTADTSAPGIPQGVTVTDTSIRAQNKFSLTVTWDAPANEGSGIDHYNVERNPDEEGNDVWTEISQVSGTGYLDTGLTQNDWYSYRVYAADSANAVSAASTEITEQARGRYYEAPSLVGTPGVNVRIQSAVVEWLTDREGTSFVEYGETNAYGYEQGQEDFVSAHEVTLVNLEPNTTYHYRVRWKDEDNNVGYSSDSTFTTADALSEPTNLAVSPAYNTENSFSFSWDEPIDEGAEVQGYFYSINSTPTDQNTSFTASTSIGPGPYATQQGTNTFYVVAIDDDNNINYGNYASIDFEAETKAPAIPTGLIITDSSNREHKVYSITLVWEAVVQATAESAEDITYIIERSVDEDDEFEPIAETTSYGYLDVGLDNTKEHFYKVKAKDTAGATSAASSTVSEIPEGRYTTPPAITSPPLVIPHSFSAAISWETDRNADSHIEYGLTEALGEEQGTIEESEKHLVTIEGLDPETKYFYRIRSRDVDGNVALSAITTFTTQEAPRVSEVEISDVKLFDALIKWKTNLPLTTSLDYGTSTAYGLTTADTSGSLTTTHTMKLENLLDGTTYHIRLTGTDVEGNTVSSDDYSFTTLTFPEVLTVEFENKTEGQTEVSWTTNVPTSSEVEYYNDAIAPKTQGNSAQVTEHSVLLFGLEDATTYQFVVKGFDQFGYQAESEENTFTTLEDTTPPEISGVASESNTIGSGETSTIQIIINWKTNEPTTSQVEYGVGLSSADFSNESEENAELVMDHLVVISDLSPAKTYHFRTVARDKAGNLSKSGSYTVLTSRKRESFLQLVISNLEETFSWVGNVF